MQERYACVVSFSLSSFLLPVFYRAFCVDTEHDLPVLGGHPDCFPEAVR